jgi:CRISPR/Cas system CSM-associated protein Csm4 (group 5 of RAMP superfamily)
VNRKLFPGICLLKLFYVLRSKISNNQQIFFKEIKDCEFLKICLFPSFLQNDMHIKKLLQYSQMETLKKEKKECAWKKL